jgi:hypothetical protein
MKTLLTATLLLTAIVPFSATAQVSPYAGTQPHIQFTVPVQDAGAMFFDGTYMWVCSASNIVAVSTSGTVVSEKALGGTLVNLSLDESYNMWVTSTNPSQLQYFNVQAAISTGNAPVTTIPLNIPPTGPMVLDQSQQQVWIASGDSAVVVSMGAPHGIIRTVTTPNSDSIIKIGSVAAIGILIKTEDGTYFAYNTTEGDFFDITGAMSQVDAAGLSWFSSPSLGTVTAVQWVVPAN